MWDSQLRECIEQLVVVEGRNFTIEGTLHRMESDRTACWFVTGRGTTMIQFQSDEIANIFALPAHDRCLIKIVLR